MLLSVEMVDAPSIISVLKFVKIFQLVKIVASRSKKSEKNMSKISDEVFAKLLLSGATCDNCVRGMLSNYEGQCLQNKKHVKRDESGVCDQWLSFDDPDQAKKLGMPQVKHK